MCRKTEFKSNRRHLLRCLRAGFSNPGWGHICPTSSALRLQSTAMPPHADEGTVELTEREQSGYKAVSSSSWEIPMAVHSRMLATMTLVLVAEEDEPEAVI